MFPSTLLEIFDFCTDKFEFTLKNGTVLAFQCVEILIKMLPNLASGVSFNALCFKKITVFGQIIRLDGGLHPST